MEQQFRIPNHKIHLFKVKESKDPINVTIPCTSTDCKPGGGADFGKGGVVSWKEKVHVECRSINSQKNFQKGKIEKVKVINISKPFSSKKLTS